MNYSIISQSGGVITCFLISRIHLSLRFTALIAVFHFGNFPGFAALHVGRQLLASCDGEIQVFLAFIVQVKRKKNPLRSDF